MNVGDNASPTPSGPVYAKAAPSKVALADGGGDGGGSSNPEKLVDREYRIAAFTVNAGRLFWLTTPEIITSKPPDVSETFNTCVVANCAGTVKTYAVKTTNTEVFGSGSTIATNASEVYWTDVDWSHGIPHCPKSGCVTPDYLVTGQGETPFFVVDDTTFYFGLDTLASCAIGDCIESAQRFAMTAPTGAPAFGGTNALVLDGNYLYLIDYPLARAGARILRTRKDGTGTFDVIASNVPEAASLVARNGAVYWQDMQPFGSVFTCPETGCVGAPRTVVGDLASSESIAVDDDDVYLTYSGVADVLPGGVPNTDELLRCPISGCDRPTTIAAKVGIEGPVAVDDAYVYFSGTDCAGLEQTPQYVADQCSYIAAVPK